MRVVRARQKQRNWNKCQELLAGGVLVSVVDLLPHVEIVIGPRIELERHAAHVVEHDIRPQSVEEVCERPAGFLRHARETVEN